MLHIFNKTVMPTGVTIEIMQPSRSGITSRVGMACNPDRVAENVTLFKGALGMGSWFMREA